MAWKRDHQWEEAMLQEYGERWRGEAPQAWRKGPLSALVSRDEIAPGDQRWHISLRHNDRIPTWDEMVKAAHELRPGVVFVIPMPPRSWWINVHPHVLHLHETRDEALIAQWRAEGKGHRPT